MKSLSNWPTQTKQQESTNILISRVLPAFFESIKTT